MTRRVFVAGHRGMVGSALVRALGACPDTEIMTRSRAELDLLDQAAVFSFFAGERFDHVYVAAARVGGIHANNTERYDFLYENLSIAGNLIEGSRRAHVGRLLFLGSSCIYPRDCSQPMSESSLLTGALDQTNEPYAIAKIAGVKLVESCNRQYGTDYLAVMPTNLYGPGDTYDLDRSHVLPAMLRRFHEAKLAGHQPVAVWGSGAPLREFLHADDLAAACLLLMENLPASAVPGGLVNVGSGCEVTIRELAILVQGIVGHRGDIVWDASRPDGAPRKLLDSTRIQSLGWCPSIDLASGIAQTYADLRHLADGFD